MYDAFAAGNECTPGEEKIHGVTDLLHHLGP